ncbi:uncharacterized protein LOC101744334 isoform X1 [Bombyx mori]|uniref:Uncharacterized protein n=2 Tax=Bombyx mori TaxID=7091 RepID=A0A8R2M9M8_BOMMO|nr:uncharacterized protein LOC101744334 isoform X1 [Bombyx mori]
MASTFNESMFDFDLNFLHPTTPSDGQINKFEKQRKAILIVKKKTIATDSLIKKYYEKKDLLDQTEKSLLTSKEECKQICIDYRKSMETCSKLENDMQILQNVNKGLESKCFQAENQYAAATSLTHQLQMLVKEQETQIESLSIESGLLKSNSKEHEKKISTLLKDNEVLLKHMCLARNIILGKKKLNKKSKLILKTYEKHKCTSEHESDDDDSVIDDSYDEAPSSPMDAAENIDHTTDEVNALKSESISVAKKLCVQRDFLIVKNDTTECNDAISVDAGRGSSLAFSDSDKCFHSPDYYMNDSPLSDGSNTNKQTKRLQNTASSPIQFTEYVEASTSPVEFEQYLQTTNNDSKRKNRSIFDSPEKLRHAGTEDNSLSPVMFSNHKNIHASEGHIVTTDVATSPINHFSRDTILQIQHEDKALSPIKLNNHKHASTSPDRVKTMNVMTSPIRPYSTDTNVELIQADKALSPILLTEHRNVSTSPIRKQTANVYTSPRKCLNTETNLELEYSDKTLSPLTKCSNCKNTPTSPKCIQSINVSNNPIQLLSSQTDAALEQANKEKECLELHNSTNIQDDNCNDNEIDMILRSMRMDHNLITPIPLTPTKSQSTINHVSKVSHKQLSVSVCQDAALVREENKQLQASIAELAKEVMSIKLLLRNRQLPKIPEKPSGLEDLNEINIEASDLVILNSPPKTAINPKDKEFKKSHNKTNELDTDKSEHSIQECVQNVTQKKIRESLEVRQVSPRVILKSSDVCVAQNKNINDSNDVESTCVHDQTPLVHNGEPTCPISNQNPSNIQNIIDNNVGVNVTEPICDYFGEPSPIKEGRKVVKSRKMTKLDKLKQKLLPKCKIKTNEPLAKKLQLKPCKVLIPRIKRIVTDLDSSATLNNKDVYEKALKAMAELKAKNRATEPVEKIENSSNNKDIPKTIPPNETSTLQENKKHIEADNQCSADINLDNNLPQYTKPQLIITRSRSKSFGTTEEEVSVKTKSAQHEKNNSKFQDDKNENEENCVLSNLCRKRTRQNSDEKSNTEPVPCKRVLRSSASNIKLFQKQSDISNASESIKQVHSVELIEKEIVKESFVTSPQSHKSVNKAVSSFSSETEDMTKDVEECNEPSPKESILCKMIQKYGVKSVRYCAKKIPESVSDPIVKKIEEGIAKISELPANETKKAMDKLVADLKKNDTKHLISALIKYLKNPDRKTELFKTVNSPPAPPMTQSEQVLLYIISQLNMSYSSTDIVEDLLKNIEFTLFALNRTPEFVVIESMAHFYAVLCRYFKFKSRLRVFIMDAMYCMQFKAVPLIKQCLDVWMLILPLAHMGIAKSPLVTCLVYLLHFYKCEDKFNRVQEIRSILHRKYFYQVTEWNEPKIMEMLKSSIMEIRTLSIEKKMLRMAIIIFAKRHGTKWCQKNIINKILLPIIERENVPSRVKEFCLSMLGPLMKPYPADMKVHCEVVMNQLIDMFQQNTSQQLKEAIVKSLLYMDRHNQCRVIKVLIDWRPKTISPELEDALRDFVKSKPLRTWKITLAKIR